MKNQEWDGLEPTRPRLRVFVARFDAQLVRLVSRQSGEATRRDYCMRQSAAA